MNRIRGAAAAAALLLGAWILVSISPTAAHAKLRVLAATNDLGALARAAGGEWVEIDVVARPDRDPHALEVRPGTLRQAASADLYLSVGLSLDAWSAAIVAGSRNRDLRVIDCSEGITPQERPVGRVDASQGDVHPEGNPHYWLDPLNGVLVARRLAKVLGEEDPEHASQFAAFAEEFAAEVVRRMPSWSARLEGRTFVEYHRSWVYFAERFHMHTVAQVEALPGIPPAAKHLAALVGVLQGMDRPIVVREPYHPGAPVAFLVREAGAIEVVLPSSCAEPDQESYFARFDRAVEVFSPEEDGAGANRPARNGGGRHP